MGIQFSDILNLLLPVAVGAVGWLVGRRKQKNDFLAELQASIDLLAAKNRELMLEVIESRSEVIRLRKEVVVLRQENTELKVKVEELNKKLENVKTITKKI